MLRLKEYINQLFFLDLMITKEEAKDRLKRLIADFPKHTDHNEENLKFNYIEPFLIEVLGWDREKHYQTKAFLSNSYKRPNNRK